VIIRTAAEGASEEELAADVRRLQAQWEVIKTKAAQGGAPKLLHAEPDLLIRVVRDIFNEDFAQLVVQGDSEWDTIRDYVEFVAPDLAPRLKRHEGDRDVFEEHRIDEQLAKALDRKVWLPSGGSLVIDRTEAMVVIDVNTGKYVGKGGNLEETVTRNNLEAAEEIARQLRLRDLGGIIVVDFIDMVLESNRDLVVRRLVECLGRDRTKHQVAEVTSLGLVQMTRKRVGQGLLESFSEPCEACNGRGVIVHSEPVDEKRQARPERFDDRPRGGRDRDRDRGEKPADKPAAPAADKTGDDSGEPTTPKRRSRGGRGRGGRSEGAPAAEAAEAVTTSVGDVDTSEPDVTPDLAEQPPTALEDQPVLPDDEPEPSLVGEAAPAAVIPVTADAPAEAPAEAGPKRRRRATSRPAGPPSVSV
jgi:ribonuclease E